MLRAIFATDKSDRLAYKLVDHVRRSKKRNAKCGKESTGHALE